MKSLNTKFYEKSFEKYGISAQGVHWNSLKTQYIRFEILNSFINKKISQSSILDIGCGFGELIEFYQMKELIPKEYLGIDCESFMIKESKKRFPNHNFEICNILKDQIPKKDYLICSGALNIMEKGNFLLSINRCFKACEKGFIFNFLSKDSFNKIKKQELIEYCNTLTKKVTISGPYLPNDTTIFLEK